MKPPPAIGFPEGGTPAERLDRAFRQALTVPKIDRLAEEATQRREKEKLKAKRNHTVGGSPRLRPCACCGATC
jgi:hypothetical protein